MTSWSRGQASSGCAPALRATLAPAAAGGPNHRDVRSKVSWGASKWLVTPHVMVHQVKINFIYKLTVRWVIFLRVRLDI